ncbi:MAG: exodeoxyribonuclease III [Candidatus Aegiribacteria sp.]|nr:exodeoxyribonuclease III [Candidatus Aegiribacteria sp.]
MSQVASGPEGMMLKLATWNVNSIRARQGSVLRWLKEESPDVLCIQEIKVENELFPCEPFIENGYSVSVNGQKTWNGVAVLSREEPAEVIRDIPGGSLNQQKRVITVRFPGLTIVNVYVPNGGDITLERFRDKLRFLDELKGYIEKLTVRGSLVVMGDFNVAPEADDVYDPESLEGRICFHSEERSKFRDIISTGMVDIYRKFNPVGKAFSWWDYRAASFRRNMGMRLDLILLNATAAEKAVSCEIQVEPRKWERPSDHTPVVLLLEDV